MIHLLKVALHQYEVDHDILKKLTCEAHDVDHEKPRPILLE